jgi:hypothetical protein
MTFVSTQLFASDFDDVHVRTSSITAAVIKRGCIVVSDEFSVLYQARIPGSDPYIPVDMSVTPPRARFAEYAAQVVTSPYGRPVE